MLMAAVMIGVDPHKGSHTAVVTGPAEEPLGELRVRACAAQAEKLLAWAAAWPERTWAVEGAAGLGRLLARQLVAAGERVLDVQPKLACRVRLLQAGDTNKNDPDDALSVAVAALRSRACRQVIADDYPAVLKVRAERHRDLGRTRNQVACRLHAVLCDLVPGGHPKDARIAERVGEQRASFIRSHQAYGEVMGVAPTRCLEAQTGVVAAPVPSILPTPAKLSKFGDRVRFAGARREQVKHLDARAERLDAARDRPRDTNSPRAELRRGPMPCAPGYPANTRDLRHAGIHEAVT
jgi:Transposase